MPLNHDSARAEVDRQNEDEAERRANMAFADEPSDEELCEVDRQEAAERKTETDPAIKHLNELLLVLDPYRRLIPAEQMKREVEK